jgi:hypothetical protein
LVALSYQNRTGFYASRLQNENHFEIFPSASNGGSVTRRKPRSQWTRTHSWSRMGARKRVGHGGVQNSFSRAKDFGNLHNRRWSPIKKLNFFIALKTLNENGVETEKQPSRPA